jgi:hypothetical protein
MDSPLTAAARALQTGDPLAALQQIALRNDAPALALRGMAMAQLGELGSAKLLLRRAARGFGATQRLARARCATAAAEVALAARDLRFSPRALDDALRTFEAERDGANALHARLLGARRFLLLGQVARAELAITSLDLHAAPAMLRATAALVGFDIALRRGHTRAAREALDRAQRAALRARIPALSAEIERAAHVLRAPAARLIMEGQSRLVALEQVEAVLASTQLVIDACRRSASLRQDVVTLRRRPVLFALLRALAEAWPSELSRAALLEAAFGMRRESPSLRARLRVELGRLRKELRALAEIHATPLGFVLRLRRATAVAVLAPPVEGADAALLGLLGDGAAWSTSALALALGSSQRTLQRALSDLEAKGLVQGFGQARARRWIVTPVSGFTTAMSVFLPPAIGQDIARTAVGEP